MKEVRRYESLTAFLDFAEPISAIPGASRNPANSWNGDISFDQSMKLARTGWSEERPATDALIGQLTTQLSEIVDTSFEPMHDVAGGTVDVAAFLNGEPECMIRFEVSEKSAYREVVKVLVSGVTNSSSDADLIRRRGICVCALLDLIAKSGKSVELWTEITVKTGSRGTTHTHTSLVKVKDATAYLDVDQVMFAMAHPSMLRRVTFGAMEQEPPKIRSTFHFGGSYGGGYSQASPPIMAEEIGAKIVLPTLDYSNRGSFATIDTMIHWIKEQLRTLNLLKEG